MTQAQLPNRHTERDEIDANFEAITGVVNGDLRDDNIAEKAAIRGSKLDLSTVDWSKVPDGSIPASKLTAAAGGGNADLLDGYDSTAFWRKAESVTAASAAQAANADLLDSIDSTGFMQRQVAGGTERIWFARSSVTLAGGGSTHSYPINRTPQAVSAIIEGDRTVPQLGSYEYDLVNHLIFFNWFTSAGGVPGNIAVVVLIMVIA